jgi:hypothetical protein
MIGGTTFPLAHRSFVVTGRPAGGLGANPDGSGEQKSDAQVTRKLSFYGLAGLS